MLKLTQNGFEYYDYDREAIQFKNLKNEWENGVYYIKNKVTGERVAKFKSDLERDKFWYVPKPLKGSIICHLKDGLTIAPEVTIQDFVKILDDTHIIAFPCLIPRISLGIWEKTTGNEIARKAEIQDNHFRLVGTNDFDPNSQELLTINHNLDIFGCHAEANINLLDALQIVFGMEKEDHITIRKNGFFNQYGNEFDPVDCLMEHCDFEDDLKLIDVFELVANNETLKAFLTVYSSAPHINAFHTVARRKTERETNITQLEVSDSGEIYHHKSHCWFDWGYEFDGSGPPEANMFSEEEPIPKTIGYAVDLVPINDISRLPLHLNHEYKIVEYGNIKNEKLNRIEHFKGQRDFRVLDVLDAIYDEITFHGTPSKQAKFYDALVSRVNKIKEKPKNE